MVSQRTDPRVNNGRVEVIGVVYNTEVDKVDFETVGAALSSINKECEKYLWNYEMPEFKVELGKVVCKTTIGRCKADSLAIGYMTLHLSILLPEFVFTMTDLGLEILVGLAVEHGVWNRIKGWRAYIYQCSLYVLPLESPFTPETSSRLNSTSIQKRMAEAFEKQNTYIALIDMPEKAFAFLQKNPRFLGVAVRSCRSSAVDASPPKVQKMLAGGYGKAITSYIKLKKTQYLMLLQFNEYLPRVGLNLYLGLMRYMKRKGLNDYENFTFKTFIPEYTDTTLNGWVFEYLSRKHHLDMFFPSHDEEEEYHDKTDPNALFYSTISFEDSEERDKFYANPKRSIIPFVWSDDEFEGKPVDTSRETAVVRARYQGECDVLDSLSEPQDGEDYDELDSEFDSEFDSQFDSEDDYIDGDIDDDDYDYSDDDSEDFSEDSEEDSDDYDSEQEVLETIKADPDLFMKVMTLQSERGESVAEISKFIDTVKDTKAPELTGTQKGVKDIKPERFDESDSWEDDDDALYNETMAQVRARLGNASVEDSE